MNYCIVTTINPPTKAIEKLYEHFGKNLIIVADKKTPTGWNYKDIVPIREIISPYAPYNHYARKNIGYMTAIKNKASLIFDSDDDNIPNGNWKIRTHNVEANESKGEGWFNAYSIFSNEYIWPRGFTLRYLKRFAYNERPQKTMASSIQQGLADGEPDVDAIWRLVLKQEINFTVNKSVYIKPNTWCPFNSQSTWWFPKAYPLMYLPVTATFRMTDIFRSFVAQKCLWTLDEGVTFHSPSEVFQDRNEHDLLKDFEQEVHGYLNVDTIVETLQGLKLKTGEESIFENMLMCYQAIVDKGILPEMEIRSVKAWIKDYENITANMG